MLSWPQESLLTWNNFPCQSHLVSFFHGFTNSSDIPWLSIPSPSLGPKRRGHLLVSAGLLDEVTETCARTNARVLCCQSRRLCRAVFSRAWGQFDITIGVLHKEIHTLCIRCAGSIGQGWRGKGLPADWRGVQSKLHKLEK